MALFFFVASRLGRYTSETKTTYTIEVQKLQLQGKLDNQRQGLLTDEERAAELDQLIEQVTENTVILYSHPPPLLSRFLINLDDKQHNILV